MKIQILKVIMTVLGFKEALDEINELKAELNEIKEA